MSTLTAKISRTRDLTNQAMISETLFQALLQSTKKNKDYKFTHYTPFPHFKQTKNG